MNALSEIKYRFGQVLKEMVEDASDLLEMIRPAQDSKFGDYQANCAMPMKNLVGKSPRQIADEIISKLQIDDLCQSVEVAGPGFINLTLDDNWLKAKLTDSLQDPRLGIKPVQTPGTYVVDFSSPNVAKPMHVGHIRSTLIGDALSRTLRFVGHEVVTDNHLGDWGTQFGMIIYGYKHFVDKEAYANNSVEELGRLYKLVRQIMDYHTAVAKLPALHEQLTQQQNLLLELEANQPTGDKAIDKKLKKDIGRLKSKITEQEEQIAELESKIETIDRNQDQHARALKHKNIGTDVLNETAKLHSDDTENLALWNEFLPFCREDIKQIYDQLNIEFDYELGESFYHSRLAGVVDSLNEKGLSRESEGAICVFMDNYETPMIIRKKDGAFLYATTDLATIQYRVEKWQPTAILYVVDHRQHQHFEKTIQPLLGKHGIHLVHYIELNSKQRNAKE